MSIGQLHLPLLQESWTRILLLTTGNAVNENGYIHVVYTGTHKATDSRDSGHFLDGKAFIGGSCYTGNNFTELDLMKHQFGSSPARAVVEDIFGR